MRTNAPRTIKKNLFQKVIKTNLLHKYKDTQTFFKLTVSSVVNEFKYIKDFLRNLTLTFK
jgi:hypothetical protein